MSILATLPDFIKVIILGIIEGVTEFLPISSTGHLIIGTAVLEFNNFNEGTFEIFIQIGATLAVVWYFRDDLWRQLRTIHKDPGVQRLWFSVLMAFIPTAILGLSFNETMKRYLLTSEVVGSALIFGGFVFLLVERFGFEDETRTYELTEIRPNQALTVGLLQALALIPGMSRSGVSIIGGMLVGMSRETATRFSFYLAIPTLMSATLFELFQARDTITSDNLFDLVLGAGVSGIVAWLSIGWLLRYVSNNSFVPFGLYRIAAGIVILLLIADGTLA